MSQKCYIDFKAQGRRFHLVANEKVLPYLNQVLNFLTTKPYVYILCRKGLNKRNAEHAHIYVCFSKPVRISAKNTHGCHIAKCRGTTQQNIDYIKSHHPTEVCEKGTVPENDGDEPPRTWDTFVKSIYDGKVDKDSQQYARYEGYAKRRMAELKPKKRYDGSLKAKNIWIHGPPGTGKSVSARFCDDKHIYEKNLNKWWDAYEGQKVVIIDDIDPDKAKALASHIKIWSDRYPFVGEIKGGAMRINPTYNLIVTSNYTIQECFNEVDAKAIGRRFSLMEMSDVMESSSDEE